MALLLVRARGLAHAGAAVAFAAIATGAPNPRAFEAAPINYSHTAPQDAVAHLLKRIATHEVTLAGSDTDILRAVLRELGVPISSQLLVFSKTSAQAGLIHPENPRALYFSDSIYVGYVPGGLIEVAAVDPQLGPVFYSFDPQDARDARRTLVRDSSCLRCHDAPSSREIPGLLARSVFTTAKGEPLHEREGEADLVDDATSFASRWGGWYVSGYTGREAHRGNAFGVERDGKVEFNASAQRPVEFSSASSPASAFAFNPSNYLTNTSDVVALLVFQHQLAMHNSLTLAAQRYRRAAVVDQPAETKNATLERVLAEGADEVVDHLLFRNAAPLPDGIEGADTFRRVFTEGAPRNAHGDALKDLSWRGRGRLFANRCSFLIYSDSFAALPTPLKDRIFTRLDAALHDDDPHGRYAYLETAEKHRILEVLRATLADGAQRFTPPRS